tara:strand:- start:41974 stop:43482 length:1509 start_codon:yes stop_codon:yes gene_type:complete
MKLYTAKDTKRLDYLTIKDQKITDYKLMEKASEFALETLVSEFKGVKKLLIFCSKGNNSGDGFLLADLSKKSGYEVTVIMANSASEIKGTAKIAYQRAIKNKVKFLHNNSLSNESLPKETLLIDALIGTGLKGAPKKNIAKLIKRINYLGKKLPIMSLDIPSGINPDSGFGEGDYVIANTTCSFVAQKRGCFTSLGRSACGELFFSSLGLTKKIQHKVTSDISTLNTENILKKILKRDPNSHKGNHGRLIVIGGDFGMGGAAILAAKSAALSGAGLVTLVTRPEHVSATLSHCPQVMAVGVDSGQDLEPYLHNKDVVVIGPGLGISAWSEQLLQRTIALSNKNNIPIVVDADGIHLIAKKNFKIKNKNKLILTPHPGEASKLSGIRIEELEKDRYLAIAKIQKYSGGTVVLKGPGTLICTPSKTGRKISVCLAGNAGMATGGMGDVLSGLIGSFISQGLNIKEGTELAVDLHSQAADLASLDFGQVGLTPDNVIESMRELIR